MGLGDGKAFFGLCHHLGPFFFIFVGVTKLATGGVISSSLYIYYCDEITRLLTKNLKIFSPKSPKIVTSKGLTNQYTCIRDQIKRMPINELSIFKKNV
jgi:hypothetical protein